MRAAGRGSEAAARLRLALPSLGDDAAACAELAALWASLLLRDLERSPASILEEISELEAKAVGACGDRFADLRWLLGALATGQTVRLNCGGEEYRDGNGNVWSRHRFYTGGHRYFGDEADTMAVPFRDEIAATEADPHYRTERWFRRMGSRLPGYRLPLPQGLYRLRLHFAEIFHVERGERIFTIRVEGRDHPREFDLLAAGFATAQTESLDVRVVDGTLDLEFVHQVGDPKISALEIEKLE